MIWENEASWYDWFHKGNSATSSNFGENEGNIQSSALLTSKSKKKLISISDIDFDFAKIDFAISISISILDIDFDFDFAKIDFAISIWISILNIDFIFAKVDFAISISNSIMRNSGMLPSFSSKIGRCRWISFVKSLISWCLILSNHAHESILEYFSSDGCCLHFPCKLVHVAEFPLWIIHIIVANFVNHAHERLLQYFSSNGCCLHFPPNLEDVAESSQLLLIWMISQRKFLHFYWFWRKMKATSAWAEVLKKPLMRMIWEN